MSPPWISYCGISTTVKTAQFSKNMKIISCLAFIEDENIKKVVMQAFPVKIFLKILNATDIT